MSAIKTIRDRLGVTQASLADGMGCTQGNVWHYEHGQTVPPDAAKRLIAYAKSLGFDVTFDDIYCPHETGKKSRATKEMAAAESDASQPVLVLDQHTVNEPKKAA